MTRLRMTLVMRPRGAVMVVVVCERGVEGKRAESLEMTWKRYKKTKHL